MPMIRSNPVSDTLATRWFWVLRGIKPSVFMYLGLSRRCCLLHGPYRGSAFGRQLSETEFSRCPVCFHFLHLGGTFLRAFCNPIRTLSAIRERSNSATAPSTVNTILPVAVEVSTCSEMDTKSMPTVLNVSNA